MSVRTLSLLKDGHRYVFRYSSGCEGQVVDEIASLADDQNSGLSWLDAATLSFQVTQQAARGAQRAMIGFAPSPGSGAGQTA